MMPFGYRMESGRVVPHPAEAEAVREIFRRYLDGTPYNTLVDILRERGPAYSGDKPWNKNMVARILGNAKYTGGQGFPPLISEAEFDRAKEQRTARMSPPKKTPAQKELRRLCGGNPPRYVEEQVLGTLNRITENPELLRAPEVPNEETAQACILRRELSEALKKPPVDEAWARQLAMELAAESLNAIGPEAYEAERLRRLFSCLRPRRELDANLLRASVRKITIRKRTASILLKNGQYVEGGSST